MSKRILVVDDERDLALAVVARVQASGYDAVAVYSGKECLQAVEKDKFDLVVMDIVMPELDGIATACRLRSKPDTENIPIVFLSALVSKDDLQGAYGVVGGNVIIPKPFNGQDLISAIERQLKNQHKAF